MNEHESPEKKNRPSLVIERRALKISEAAAVLGVKPISIRRLIERGLLQPCRALRHPLIPIEQIEALLNNR